MTDCLVTAEKYPQASPWSAALIALADLREEEFLDDLLFRFRANAARGA
jgi:hypothetical protein